MNLPISLIIARRYAQASKDGKFVGLISLFSKAGIAIGVMALIIVISVMDGFEGVLKQRILNSVPHIVIQPKELSGGGPDLITLSNQLEYAHPQIQQILPLVQTTALLQMPNDLQGVMVQGIKDQDSIPLGVKSVLVNGRWQDFFSRNYGVVIGRYLALQKGIGLGDKVRLIVSGASSYTPLGRLPAQRNFTVVGFFETESELDQQMVFVKSDNLNRLLKQPTDSSQGIRLVLNDAFSAQRVVAELDNRFDLKDFEVKSWHSTHGKLFDAVKMEKNMMWLMLSLIVAVAAFNIVSALVMMVTQKQGEIAILKTLGLSNTNVAKVFTLQGMLNGVVGSIWGVVLGSIVTLGINPLMAVTNINILGVPGLGLPVEFNGLKVVAIAALAIGLALLASVYPARRAAKLQPADVLRYE
ncbi:lipoprotein-releasing ABC transporter permease subunit [Psychrosphaera ytuae]|uniref:Lipoprotein-releasing ABC transporter permease subunit n=1 Tax=Psychrosphaera ytuae TaxID=2820710 RepID=A0A975DC10_9GAMM|nr:lipoprotein-releasing ABC transporter permease subunit [Psychrosphaera ytuae]QTH64158.1 lipoprotein-releasing ABC transporter permease subunit [Psychrosphaera ytuae]